jgi:hypothetical protein
MKLGLLKKTIQNLPDDADLEIQQAETYFADLIITVAESEDFPAENSSIKVTGIDFTTMKANENT